LELHFLTNRKVQGFKDNSMKNNQLDQE